jgi:hypothetical protein
LVWATTELLVEQMNGYGLSEFYRRKAEALAMGPLPSASAVTVI